MGYRFGNRLRFERCVRGLSQMDLARGFCSIGHISLLEAGIREPSREAIAHLSHLLGIDPEDLNPTDPTDPTHPTEPTQAEALLAGFAAREAWDARDYSAAAARAATAAQLAFDAGQPSDGWAMSQLEAESLAKLGSLAESRQILGYLLTHPIASESPALASRTHSLLAAVCHQLGQADTAIIHARAALHLTEHLPPASGARIDALRALIAPLADGGELDEAWLHCGTLAALALTEGTAQLAGLAEWTIGTVAFQRGEHGEGIRHHNLAAALLSPASDLELWAQFTKASAAARLAAGVLDHETLAMIDKAEVSFEIVGGTARDRVGIGLIRAQWLFLTAQREAAAEKLAVLWEQARSLEPALAGDAALLHGRVLAALGRSRQALERLDEARGRYVQAEAWPKVTQCMEAGLHVRVTAKSIEAA